MISFHKYTLENGLRVLIHEDPSTPMAVVNLLYNVGARHEEPERTGFAHLFEHLMFGGSQHAPDFDSILQTAGGENNAFTSNDVTNYYEVLPAVNVETALWLEADRMQNLLINEQTLSVQQKVVIEEFKENYINQPYGDVWHQLRELTYTTHPYQWPTIGKNLEHIEQAVLDDVLQFYNRFYTPRNAILVVGGGVKAEAIFKMAEKYFGPIEKEAPDNASIPQEPEQTQPRQKTVEADVPANMIYKAWHMTDRMHDDYYVFDLASDILSSGKSSRFYTSLVKEKQLFTAIDAYISGNIDKGIFVVQGRLAKHTTMEQADEAILNELNTLKEKIEPYELQKVQNKVEAGLEFEDVSLLNRAYHLAFYELLQDAHLYNEEKLKYQRVKVDDLKRLAANYLSDDRCSTLYYKAKKKAE